MQNDKVDSLLEQLREATDLSGLPPVEQWDPPCSGAIDIRIAEDGRWYYQGDLMAREAMVKLFAGILRREQDGEFYLVTPVEKVRIEVEDAPFTLVDYHWIDQGQPTQVLELLTNLDERLTLGGETSFCFSANATNEVPYVPVRRGLLAKMARSTYYRLVNEILEHAEAEKPEEVYVISQGQRHFLAR